MTVATYLFFCAACDHWSTGQTASLFSYRFSCKYCCKTKRVLCKGSPQVIFKGPYEAYDAVQLCKEVNMIKAQLDDGVGVKNVCYENELNGLELF
ncbi:hypothetical protein HOC01_01460 [archaeon]|nr:hypothetical protein [archaeon]MBT6698013.1 hypothetical protein [archaeon]